MTETTKDESFGDDIFRALLKFRINTGDKELASSKTCTYIRNRIQNEIILYCGEVKTEKFVISRMASVLF